MTTDTIEQAAVLATVQRVAHVSTAMAQPVTRTDDFAPGRPHTIVGPWPTPDLTHRGLVLIGHPPFMLRPPGPVTPIPDVDELVVTVAVDGPSLEVVEQVLIEGFPLPELLPVESGRAFDTRVLGGPTRFFVGWHRDAPVATASGTLDHGVALVEFVATLADARGKGFGAMVTPRASDSCRSAAGPSG